LAGFRRVIAPDIPGLGESADPPKPYAPESIATIIADGLASVLGPHERLDVAGFSFGGMISGLVAREVAARVDSITLIGASGLGGRFDARAPVRKLPPGGDPEALREVHVHNLGTMMLHAASAIDDLAVWIQATNAPRTRVMSPEHALSHKLEQALRDLDVPIVSIWGAHCIFRSDLERRRALLASIRPDAVFYRVAGAGHWVQYEAADVVNRLLASHLSAPG
jgi:pimeloyl-ACP methyl ester carboxylesterase